MCAYRHQTLLMFKIALFLYLYYQYCKSNLLAYVDETKFVDYYKN